MVAKGRSNELTITRIYDAPVEAVWDAWTDPEQVAQWWGPRGFTLTTHSKDLRPGGTWHYTMHGPDGTDYPNKTRYIEVEPQAKLVYDHGGYDDRPPLFRVTVLFSEMGDRTAMEMRMTLPTPEAAEETRKFIKEAGGNATWDRLAEYLEKQVSDRELFVIHQTFEAPRERVFEMWIHPHHLSRWLPPPGLTMQFIRSEICPGRCTLYNMTDASGVRLYGKANYLAIERPDRLVYTQQFCDEHENVTRNPKSATWPATILSRVAFTEEGPDCTGVTVFWEPNGVIAPDELETFIQARAGMTAGWSASFDQLEAYLAWRETPNESP